jgi:hypothetical protein
MDGLKISQQNRKAVELVILVKAGTTVRNMDPMKKSSREEVLLRKYMQIINKIEDIHFEDESVRAGMLAGYKGAKKSLTGATLLRKLELEMKDIRKFAAKFPGFNNPTELPSGTTQLSHMNRPVIVKLWKSRYPVKLLLLLLHCSLTFFKLFIDHCCLLSCPNTRKLLALIMMMKQMYISIYLFHGG